MNYSVMIALLILLVSVWLINRHWSKVVRQFTRVYSQWYTVLDTGNMVCQVQVLQLFNLMVFSSFGYYVDGHAVAMVARTSFDNSGRLERLLVAKPTRSLVKCAELCLRTPSCVSMFYNKATRVCCTHSVVFGRLDVRLCGLPAIFSNHGNRYYSYINQAGLGKVTILRNIYIWF